MNETPQLDLNRHATATCGGHHRLAAVVLVLFALLACLARLGSGPTLGDHEAINALGARQTLESGQWLVPRVGEVMRVRKPPLGIWSIAAASWLVDDRGKPPVTELSARLPSAVAAAINVLVVCWLGTMLFGRRAGLVAGFVMAGCTATLFYARNAQVDMLLAMLTALSYACFWRGAMHERPSKVFMALFYVVFAAAMMAKAPLPMVTVGMALAVYWFVTLPLLAAGQKPAGDDQSMVYRTFSGVAAQALRLPRLWLIPGIVLFVVLAGAWPLYIYSHVPNALNLWKIEYLSRYSGELSKKSGPFYYYIPMAFALAVPFMISLPEAVAGVFLKRYRSQRAGMAFALTWAVVGTAFLSTASYKRPYYLLSMMPAYCLLLAPVIERLFFVVLTARRRTVVLACLLVPIILAVGFAVGGQMILREFAALQRTYVVAAIMLWALWTAAAMFFAFGRRTAAFALLNGWVLVVVLLAWPAIGRQMRGEPAVVALIEQMRAHKIPEDATIYWLEGRPDSSVEFYTGYRLQRLIDELEMSKIRPNRTEVGDEVLMEIASRIEKKMSEPRPVYLILSSGNFEKMERETNIRARKILEMSGFKNEPGEEWVVITQPGPQSGPATRAGTSG